MKDPSDELIQALYDALSGNVSYGGSTIGVYTRVIEWDDLPSEEVIRIAEVRYDETGPKDATITSGTVDIYVDTYFTGKNEGSKKPMNAISNSVMGLIDQALDMTNFTMIRGRVAGAEGFDYELDPQGAVFRKLITFEYDIQED